MSYPGRRFTGSHPQPAANDNSTHSRVIHYSSDANWHDGRTPDPNRPEGLLYGRTDRHGVKEEAGMR